MKVIPFLQALYCMHLCCCERLRLSSGEVPWVFGFSPYHQSANKQKKFPQGSTLGTQWSPVPLVTYISGVLRGMWGRTDKHLTHFDLYEI